MTIKQQIAEYIATQPEAKRADIKALQGIITKLMPRAKLWFLDGKDEKGKTVTNPNIGYGVLKRTYADGSIREFYQIGLSANTSGISVYLMGLEDRKYLPAKYGKTLGKASVTGYCIKFKALRDIDVDVLQAAMRDVIKQTSA